ncbi:MAG: hypothetical protein AB1Z98_15080, partial [Nannocystaceae bacterium]
MDRYLIQKDGEVHEWPEKKLRKKLRNSDLSGLELARHEDEEGWRPLHDLPIFREEVPYTGDPRVAAQRRVAKGFAWHLTIYLVITSFTFGVMSIAGAIWGLFLLGHATRALPATWSLVREGKLLGGGDGPAPALGPGNTVAALPSSTSAPGSGSPALAAATGFDADLHEVRQLLATRDQGAPILAELDRVAQTVSQLRDKITRLSALLVHDEPGPLQLQRQQAQAALAAADDPEDRALRQRQIEVLGDRLDAIARARTTLERLELRESLA